MNWISYLFFASLFIFIPPSKKEVKDAINEKTEKFGGTESWYAKDDDSCFFKSDTIRLCKNPNYLYRADSACNLIAWSFYKRKIDFGFYKQCEEPPPYVCYTDGRYWFNYTLKECNGSLDLTLKNKFGTQAFRIIELKDAELSKGIGNKIMTLVRKK